MVLVWSDYFSSLPHQSPIYSTFHRVYPRRQWLFKFDTSPDLLNSALARIMFVLFVFPMFRSGFSFNYFSVPVYTSRGKKSIPSVLTREKSALLSCSCLLSEIAHTDQYTSSHCQGRRGRRPRASPTPWVTEWDGSYPANNTTVHLGLF